MFSAESKAKISATKSLFYATHKGIKLSDAHKKSLSAAAKLGWVKRKDRVKADRDELLALRKLVQELKENEKTPTE